MERLWLSSVMLSKRREPKGVRIEILLNPEEVFLWDYSESWKGNSLRSTWDLFDLRCQPVESREVIHLNTPNKNQTLAKTTEQNISTPYWWKIFDQRIHANDHFYKIVWFHPQPAACNPHPHKHHCIHSSETMDQKKYFVSTQVPTSKPSNVFVSWFPS